MRAPLPIPILFLSATLYAVPTGVAQPSTEGVHAVIDQLFDGMRAGDSTMVRATLHPDVRFQSVSVRDGVPVLQTGDADAFVQAVGTPHEAVWDERIRDVQVHVDGHLAQAWMHYSFFLGDTFSHCGVNAFQLYHDGDAWVITQIADTRRREACDEAGDP